MSKKKIIIIACIVLALLGGATAIFLLKSQSETSDNQTSASFDESDENTEHTVSSKNIDLGSYESGAIVKINAGGEYILSGKLTGQIVVEVSDQEKVQLYLNNADITNPTDAAILVMNADKTIITLNEGTANSVTDGSTYTDTERDATIYSHDDLTINGSGSLSVKANYNNGIESRDDLKITGGDITIVAAHHGLFGNNSFEAKTASISITAGMDGIHTDGDMIIESGTFVISVDDDGMHADNNLTINNGTITIKNSYEGIEATNVIINNGTIDITASDDGINGAGGNDDNSSSSTTQGGRNRPQDNFSKSTGTITINGGNITIAAATSGDGDGLDSNGNIVVTGGDTIIKTPAVARDYTAVDFDGTFTMTGGRIRTLSQNGTYTEVTQNNVSSGMRR
ncbi:MAG: carbohydrate-binding domain-containing protein [Candidatus Saccharimonadales bacterium]